VQQQQQQLGCEQGAAPVQLLDPESWARECSLVVTMSGDVWHGAGQPAASLGVLRTGLINSLPRWHTSNLSPPGASHR